MVRQESTLFGEKYGRDAVGRMTMRSPFRELARRLCDLGRSTWTTTSGAVHSFLR